MKRFNVLLRIIAVLCFVGVLAFPVKVFATEESTDNNIKKYYFKETIYNAGKDTGYKNREKISGSDWHFGWSLGQFFVSGHTNEQSDAEGNPVFLKNVGDKIGLSFVLKQDINKLNNDENMVISEDTNGFDEEMSVMKTNFGKGALFVRFTDYQNKTHDTTTYFDFLTGVTVGADTSIDLFEEGDYEVSLDYEIKNTPRKAFGIEIVPEYCNYKITFKFSVRNGNCMVYPFELKTGAELNNTAIAESGFRLDLAKSRYLDINVKKEVLKEGVEGLVEDTRYNRPAKDGDEYTEEGVYTITAMNKYTSQETVKKIYVGTNKILKAAVINNITVDEVNKKIKEGASINEEGVITLANVNNEKNQQVKKTENKENDNTAIIIILIGIAVVIIATVLLINKVNNRKKTESDKLDESENRDESEKHDELLKEEE